MLEPEHQICAHEKAVRLMRRKADVEKDIAAGLSDPCFSNPLGSGEFQSREIAPRIDRVRFRCHAATFFASVFRRYEGHKRPRIERHRRDATKARLQPRWWGLLKPQMHADARG